MRVAELVFLELETDAAWKGLAAGGLGLPRVQAPATVRCGPSGRLISCA